MVGKGATERPATRKTEVVHECSGDVLEKPTRWPRPVVHLRQQVPDRRRTCQYCLTNQPIQESGKFLPEGADRPKSTHCVEVGAGTGWYRAAGQGRYSVSFGVGISRIVGANLTIAKTYHATNYTAHYKIAGSGKRMCGNNNMPATSGRIMEKR